MHYHIDEQEPSHIRKLFYMEGVKPISEAKEGEDTYEVATLATGDIVCEEVSLGIERKTVDDLWQSIKDGRLEKQCLRMLHEFDVPIVIITSRTGSMRKLESFVNPYSGATAMRPTIGMLASLISRYVLKDDDGKVYKRIQLVPGLTDKSLVVFTIAIAHKLTKSPITVAKTRHRSTTLEDAPLRMLMGIPNVNVKIASAVLEMFDSVREVANATEKKLQSVSGVGGVKASMIYDSFNSNPFKKKDKPKKV